MELRQDESVKTTTHYWGYRELAADELIAVGGGYDGDGGPGCGTPGGSGGESCGAPGAAAIGVTGAPSVESITTTISFNPSTGGTTQGASGLPNGLNGVPKSLGEMMAEGGGDGYTGYGA